MRITRLSFGCALFWLVSGSALSQDTTILGNDSGFRLREEIIQEVLSQVERELGFDLRKPEASEDTQPKPRARGRRSSLYAFPPIHTFPRNHSAGLIPDVLDDRFLFRYNRVEGVFLGVQAPRRFHWEKPRQFTVFGSLGYAFGAHRWGYTAGAAQQFGFGTELFEFGVEGHNTIDSRDRWIVGNAENTLNALFARYDYRDYFRREGFSGWLGFYHRTDAVDAQLKVAFLNDTYTSRDAVVHWSIFRPGTSFRDNPAVLEGRMRSIMVSADLHQLKRNDRHPRGWSASISSEFAGRGLKGDFSFDNYIFDLRRYQPVGRHESLNARLRLGTSHGALPPQRIHYAGGTSTLPAYGYKTFVGNRLLLANAEYLVSGDIIAEGSELPLSLLSKVEFIMFIDAGYVTAVSPDLSPLRGFDGFTLRDVKSDWGVAIGSRDGQYRLGFAWRMDEKAPVAIFFRMRRPF